MREAFETFTVDGLTVKIYPDHEPQDCPIDNNMKDEGIWFVTFQRRSTLKDFHDFASPDDVLPWAKKNRWDAFPLYYYEHGLCAYQVTEGGNPFHCPWDSGQVGWILIKHSEFRGRKHRLEVAKSWAKIITTWCNGDYYGYVIETDDAAKEDSCWGYDDLDYCKQEATSAAKFLASKLAEQRRQDQQAAYDDMYGQLG